MDRLGARVTPIGDTGVCSPNWDHIRSDYPCSRDQPISESIGASILWCFKKVCKLVHSTNNQASSESLVALWVV